MNARSIDINTFLEMASEYPVIDVRSPSEYAHAHFPEAISMPLFDDEERKVVGTTYKQQSREQAIKIGLDYFGVKMKTMVEKTEALLEQRATRTVIVHCWRGGMRSGAVAWLLALYGFKVFTLEGGYKSFRRCVLEALARPHRLKVLGGFTGSGKTAVLQEFSKQGVPVIDLEQLAMHRGSAFGGLGMPPQCSAEQFENKLALELLDIAKNYPGQAIWVESESQRIGNINMQHTFFRQMLQAPYVFLDIPFEERLKYIVQEYGSFDKTDLANTIKRIQKRLGGLETKTALQHLEQNDVASCFRILLYYYDKFYRKSNLGFRNDKMNIAMPNTDAVQNAAAILNLNLLKYGTN